MKKFISIIVFVSLALSQYNVGDQISISDQQLTKEVCYGHTLNTGDNFSLYDLNGRKIETMVNSVHRAGYYTLTLVSDHLNSGIYLIKIISSNEIQTKKITIIK